MVKQIKPDVPPPWVGILAGVTLLLLVLFAAQIVHQEVPPADTPTVSEVSYLLSTTTFS